VALIATSVACSSPAARPPVGPAAPACVGDAPAPGDAGASSADAGEAGAGAPSFTWTVAAPGSIARFEANGVVIDGELWVLGGFASSALDVTKRVDIYDPAGDSWRQGPDLPGAETHIAVVTFESDVIVAGGFTGAFTGGRRPPTTDAVWRWSTSAGAWSPGPPLPAPGAAFSWALLGTTLHLAGGLAADGNSDSDAHNVWDLAGAATWTTAAPLPVARNHGGGAATGGLFYAIAGRHSWNESSGDVANVDAFDPANGSWTARAPIPRPRSEIPGATSAMDDGRILVVGGSLAGIFPSSDVLVYDPAVDAWCALPSLPEPRKGAVAARIGSRVVVTGGSPTSIDPSATTFVGCCL